MSAASTGEAVVYAPLSGNHPTVDRMSEALMVIFWLLLLLLLAVAGGMEASND